MRDNKFRKKRKKVCFFCKNDVKPNYKNIEIIGRMVTERGKIVPRRMTGTCSKHQRTLATAIKRARNIGFLPFVSENIR